MPVRQVIERGGAPVRIFTDDIDRGSIEQLAAVLSIVVGHVAAIPDVHVGIGATIGSVIPTRRALIAAATRAHCRHRGVFDATALRRAGERPLRPAPALPDPVPPVRAQDRRRCRRRRAPAPVVHRGVRRAVRP